jgi:hypothetical protein
MINKITNLLLAFAVAGLVFAGSASAQTATSNPPSNTAAPAAAPPSPSANTGGDVAGPGDHDPGHGRVNQVNQQETYGQNRITNGAKDGELNSAQAARLDGQEDKIEAQEKADMAKNHGHLTKKEQNQLNNEQKHLDKRIWKDKHPKK